MHCRCGALSLCVSLHRCCCCALPLCQFMRYKSFVETGEYEYKYLHKYEHLWGTAYIRCCSLCRVVLFTFNLMKYENQIIVLNVSIRHLIENLHPIECFWAQGAPFLSCDCFTLAIFLCLPLILSTCYDLYFVNCCTFCPMFVLMFATQRKWSEYMDKNEANWMMNFFSSIEKQKYFKATISPEVFDLTRIIHWDSLCKMNSNADIESLWYVYIIHTVCADISISVSVSKRKHIYFAIEIELFTSTFFGNVEFRVRE